MIEGLHEDYSLARGNISATGVLLEMASAPGSPGDLELIHLASRNRERRVAIMGQIVRCVTIDSIGDTAPMVAVVFQFLPERPEVRKALGRLLQYILEENQRREDFTIEHRVPVELETIDPLDLEEIEEIEVDDAPKAATVIRLQVKRLSLETTWPLTVGDRVQIAFRSAGARLPFEGRVAHVEPLSRPSGTPLYGVDVQVGELGKRVRRPKPEDRTQVDSLDLVVSELIAGEAPPSEPAQRHLAGRLDRIALPSLLTFLEMERQSGRLAVEDDNKTTLFIVEGQVVDVAPTTDDPIGQLENVLSSREGRFAFTCESVDRQNRVQKSTTHVLLDWARQQDEASH